MIVGLAIGGVLWLAMLGTSYHGWLTLPADARVPVHFGAGYNNFVPKRIGVILPLVMCLLLVVQAGAIRVARRRSGF